MAKCAQKNLWESDNDPSHKLFRILYKLDIKNISVSFTAQSFDRRCRMTVLMDDRMKNWILCKSVFTWVDCSATTSIESFRTLLRLFSTILTSLFGDFVTIGNMPQPCSLILVSRVCLLRCWVRDSILLRSSKRD